MSLGFTITSPRQSVRQCSGNISGTAWFRQQPKEYCDAGFQGLVKRWDKCLNVQGDYVEK
jgi:hypothetical protein